jgi:putative ABC transport system ATP-binding protein
MSAVVELVGAVRRYRQGPSWVTALDGVSLSVAAGELVCVMGPSGCGKSTLLALAGGLEAPDEGSVTLVGEPLRYRAADRARRLREQVGYVFQELNLLTDLSALENVALPLELSGVPGRAARDEARRALSEVGVGSKAAAFPAELSGGEQQRVAIARALIGSRSLLLADEPTGALDSLTAEEVMQVIRGRCAAGAAAIVATHDAAQAAVADRVVFLRDGRIAGESAHEGTATALGVRP